jgi:serine/threonine protein kinase
MTLASGQRIGPYEIVGAIGAGGMGEVYRARDPRLNREVALKILPDLLAGDADRLARFRREAQVLGALNHPNIAHLLGFEDAGPVHAIVMELVEGPTLADRLAQGPIPHDESIAIARQIIDALEAAHDQGIVHRDLKPANVKVRDDGTVKVLDFGLAKALDSTDSPTSSLSNSPTITARATQLGMILGTAAYMSPEQARGRSVDRRADIWAFGVVLYEMLTGCRAFEGDDVSITLAGVLKEDVKWEALPADAPPNIRRLLRRCLEKDPKRRLSAIGDARFELDDTESATGPSTGVTARPVVSSRERWLWAAVAMLAVLAASAFVLRPHVEAAPPPPTARFSVPPPGEGRFAGSPPRFAVSPDGRFLAFSATLTPDKSDQLWLRRLDSTEIRPLAGTEGVPGALTPQSPFWSPDGRYLGFLVQSEIGTAGTTRFRTLDLQGGTVQQVCELPSNNGGGSWNSDGILLVSTQESKGIMRVPAGGGVPVAVTTLDPARKEIAHLFPQFLPDGRQFLFQVQTDSSADRTIHVGSLDSPERRMIVQSSYARFAAPNHLLYYRDATLLVQTLDPRSLELSGEPALVANGLHALANNGRAGFSVSNNGVLVHFADPEQRGDTPVRELTWFDRKGTITGTIGVQASGTLLRLNEDASRAALLDLPASGLITQARRALWVADLQRSARTPLTPDRTTSAVWSSDGTRLLFASWPEGGNASIMERAASGATAAVSVREQAGANLVPLDVAPDGTLVFASGQGRQRGLGLLTRDGKTLPFLSGAFDYPQASVSPDGKWIAYASNESNQYEITVQSFPDPAGGKWPISTNGGLYPRWRQDGRELFFVDADGRLVAAAVTTAGGFVPGGTTPLFTLPVVVPGIPVGGAYPYDVAPDGQRVLIAVLRTRATEARVPLTVTTQWTSLLK